MWTWDSYLVLSATGLVAGILNVIAGGGSFLTLPVLIFLGLPAGVANGTNRVGILMQNMGAVWGFHRYRIMDWSSLLWAAVPATLGSLAGSAAALRIHDSLFQKILAFLMVGITVLTLWNPVKKGGADHHSRSRKERILFAVSFFLVGIYGGFVQAGVGFLILAATTLGGLNLVRGNAVKVLCVLSFTVISLAVFAWGGKVIWGVGLALGLGTTVGGLIGVRLTILKGHRWLRSAVTVAVVLFAFKLWLDA